MKVFFCIWLLAVLSFGNHLYSKLLIEVGTHETKVGGTDSRLAHPFSAQDLANWRNRRENFQLTIQFGRGASLVLQMGKGIERTDFGILEAGGRSVFAKYPVLPGGWISIIPKFDSVYGTIRANQAWWEGQKIGPLSIELKACKVERVLLSDERNPGVLPGDIQKMDMAISIFSLGLNSEWQVSSMVDQPQNSRNTIVTIQFVPSGKEIGRGGLVLQFDEATVELDGQIMDENEKLLP